MVSQASVDDVWNCTEGKFAGEAHVWAYLGREAQLYRCKVCHQSVTKARLKEATDA